MTSLNNKILRILQYASREIRVKDLSKNYNTFSLRDDMRRLM